MNIEHLFEDIEKEQNKESKLFFIIKEDTYEIKNISALIESCRTSKQIGHSWCKKFYVVMAFVMKCFG
ncbi:hypothetical protein HN873_052365 [Arachis hypogaea]